MAGIDEHHPSHFGREARGVDAGVVPTDGGADEDERWVLACCLQQFVKVIGNVSAVANRDCRTAPAYTSAVIAAGAGELRRFELYGQP